MKLLQINTTVNWEATGRIAEGIGQTAMAQGWESHIAYGRFAKPSASQTFKMGTQRDVYIHKLHSFLLDRHGLASKSATRDLVAYIERLSPDIIHLHNLHGFYLNYPILFEYLSHTDTPVVWTLHDCWTYTGHCAYYDYVGCDRWKTHCRHCPQRKGYPPLWLFGRSTRNFDDKKRLFTSVGNMTIVPVSDWLASEVKQSFLGKYPIRTIHNGIDLQAFAPQPVDKSKFGLQGRFVILGVSNLWGQRKGLPDFCRLRALLPAEDYAIVLVGLTPQQIKALPDGIVGIRRTGSLRELAEYYSVADVFVNPTWEDNFPTTNLEALACGTPVVTYRTGGSVEAVDGDTGRIVRRGDVQELAAVLSEMRAAGTQHYRQPCRDRALACFDKNDRFA